ncbi:Ppx/GppA phosphatase family protein [Halorhodospira halophila]|uniref:Ppx/GppA phosphatase n=1 Tax=Halorhodospira halophila (strain DSM 244 / SL1) TaxID=349124 RepID=A1WTJ7_HALHL|nr:Ppx/GppA phosphatase family protein [Halorhodospira halophila]ABM61009.1 Ppx/GppA phosphatase [Halorhodospira halophila SL1]MBK1729982.1 exopolyphosphatase [Halorhodospira halophila]
MRDEQVIAAVDLGSNSFHMVVARIDPATRTLRVVDRLRETVRLGAGLGEGQKRLSEDARERALACLARFGDRLRRLQAQRVRAVGTNTLRRARDATDFMQEAEGALGHPIEVVSGYEEARLIYLGVAHNLGFDERRRVVIDIGGGSTELILGRGPRAEQMESVHLGCVSLTGRCFADGRITGRQFQKALVLARLELEPVEGAFRSPAWQGAVGASGTVRAAADACASRDWSPPGWITAEALGRLRRLAVEAGDAETLGEWLGLSGDRRQVFPAGLAALCAVFEALGIERMEVADGALREGVMYDLAGRLGMLQHSEDARANTVSALRRRYSVEAGQADRVAATAAGLLDQVAPGWGLAGRFYRDILDWAAQLHEIGLDISHAQYHKHGAYILRNADMAGFSRQEQQLLALLVRVHRRKLARGQLKALPRRWLDTGKRLAVVLRLAVLLHRGRADGRVVEPRLEPLTDGLRLWFPSGWLADNPLLQADLLQEQRYLERAGMTLELAEAPE